MTLLERLVGKDKLETPGDRQQLCRWCGLGAMLRMTNPPRHWALSGYSGPLDKSWPCEADAPVEG